jgi:hypothetical protein
MINSYARRGAFGFWLCPRTNMHTPRTFSPLIFVRDTRDDACLYRRRALRVASIWRAAQQKNSDRSIRIDEEIFIFQFCALRGLYCGAQRTVELDMLAQCDPPRLPNRD